MADPVFLIENYFSTSQFSAHVVSANQEAAGKQAFRVGDGRRIQIDHWSSTSLGPMEAEIAVLLGRIKAVPLETRQELVQYYLDRYAELTGRAIGPEPFVSRMPWLNFLSHLGHVGNCINRLRWVRFESRTRDYLHLCVRLCESLLAELPFQ